MKNYLVTFYPGDAPDIVWVLSDYLSTSYQVWAAEYDEGMFFITSDKSADEILEDLGKQIDLDLSNLLYVFELAGTFAGFGTTGVLDALTERLGPGGKVAPVIGTEAAK